MVCPRCKSSDTMTTSTQVKESVTIVGLFWRSEKKREETTVTHKCLDCGHVWDGEEAQ